MVKYWAFAPCCTHRILVGPWPEALVSWWQQAALLTVAFSPACSDNKTFPWCWLSLDHCAGLRSGAAKEGWGNLATSHQGKLPAVPSACTTASLHHLPAALHAWVGLQGLSISPPWLPTHHQEEPTQFLTLLLPLQVGLAGLGDVSRVR